MNMNMNMVQHYRSLQNQHGASAAYRLREAKLRAKIDAVWDDAEEKGQVRVRVERDNDICYEDLAGDCYDVEYNKDTVPGGARTIRAQEREFQRLIERDGVWGYVSEVWRGCDACGRGEWEHVDSCWGFAGGVYEDEIYHAKYAALVAARIIAA